MRISVVLNFDVPSGEASAEVLRAIDPPKLPYFAGEAHVVPEPFALELGEWLSVKSPDPLDRNLARLEALVRDFDHYANHADPEDGADGVFRTIHGHLTAIYSLATGKAELAEIVDVLERKDREIASVAIELGVTSAVGQRRPTERLSL